MHRNELTFDMIGVLKKIADKFLPELFQRVRNELGVRNLKLLDYVFKHYYLKGESGGRWYDSYHVLFSTHFAVQLLKSGEPVSPLIIPAIILHDIGYRVLTEEGKANWSAAENRIIHMQEGAALAAEILVKINSFNADEIGVVVGMVASHDNVYLDILNEQNPSRLALRDADRMWVMHFLSFYKDWISSHKEISSLSELLELRKDSLRNAKGPYTNLAQRWLSQQFEIRFQEIQDNIIRDKDVFQRYGEKQIPAELELK